MHQPNEVYYYLTMKKIEVFLYDLDGNLIDYEILSQLDVHINNNSPNPDADLIVKANLSGKFEVAIESTVGLEQQYRVVIKIEKNWFSNIEKSWDIDCTCDRPLTLDELYEDVRLLAWHPWHSDDDLRDVDPFGPIAGPTVTEQNEFLEVEGNARSTAKLMKKEIIKKPPEIASLIIPLAKSSS